MPQTDQVNAMQVIAGAELTLAAKKSVRLYRCIAVKVSNVTNDICAFGKMEHFVATSEQNAQMQYLKAHAADMVDDLVGSWTVSVVKLQDGKSIVGC